MFKIITVAFFLPLVFANPFFLQRPKLSWPITGKIVGGNPIDIREAPYQISLQYNNFHICGGSIISEKFVLTAGHCTDGNSASILKIRCGSTQTDIGGILIQVLRIIQHEKFDYFTIDYDVSLLELALTIEFSLFIKAIGLPDQDEDVEDGTMCIVTGWGNTQNSQELKDKLRSADVPIVNQDKCNEAYKSFGGVTDRMICAGFDEGLVDACQGRYESSQVILKFFNAFYKNLGDSGGPLVADNKLIGIVSWGYGCAKPAYPGVYSRVAAMRDWIRENSGV